MYDENDQIHGTRWIIHDQDVALPNLKDDDYCSKTNIAFAAYKIYFDQNPDKPNYLLVEARFTN